MSNPITRMAQEIAGNSIDDARKALECQCFSIAETSEIIAGCRMIMKADHIVTVTETIEAQIRSTLECSIRLGDRLADEINGW